MVVYQKGFMWIAQDTEGRMAWGKSRDEALANIDAFIEKEKRFEAQSR